MTGRGPGCKRVNGLRNQLSSDAESCLISGSIREGSVLNGWTPSHSIWRGEKILIVRRRWICVSIRLFMLNPLDRETGCLCLFTSSTLRQDSEGECPCTLADLKVTLRGNVGQTRSITLKFLTMQRLLLWFSKGL